jgi:hypothetical protein
MKRTLRIGAFVVLTFFIGRSVANIYLDWPAPMPDWLYHATMFAIRTTGAGEIDNPDDAEVMATVIVGCISWILTGLALWLLARAARSLRNRRGT